jgi:hypothetical protein
MPNANLTSNKKNIYHAATKLYNALPPHIKVLNLEIIVFKLALKHYLLAHSSYSVQFI